MDEIMVDIGDLIKHYRDYYHYNDDLNHITLIVGNDDEALREQLLKFAQKKQTMYTLVAWEIIIEKLDGTYFSDHLVKILCEKRIHLTDLGHKNLSSESLLLIYRTTDGDCFEALQTVLLRDIHCRDLSQEDFERRYRDIYDKFVYSNTIMSGICRLDLKDGAEPKYLYLLQLVEDHDDCSEMVQQIRQYFDFKNRQYVDFTEINNSRSLLLWLACAQNKHILSNHLQAFFHLQFNIKNYSDKMLYELIIYTINLRAIL